MDFSFTSEQQQLRDAIRRYLTQEYGFEVRRAVIRGAGTSDAAWRGLAELGLTALTVPEEHGGFGGGGVDRMVVMEELGRGLVVEPYFASAIMGTACVVASGDQRQAARMLPGVADGTRKLAVAFGERQSRHELFNVATTARVDGAGYRLQGTKTVVLHGAEADQVIVSARIAGAQRDPAGIRLFVLDRGASGLQVSGYRTIDGMRAADVVLDGVIASGDAVLGAAGAEIIEAAALVGAAALCAEAIGCMQALNEATLEYLKTRQQFGVPIGKFQVLQHRAVEMFMETEQARSLTMLAAVKVDAAGLAERGAYRRPIGDPVARRHGHDRRVAGRPLLQAPDHDRGDLGRYRPPPGSVRGFAAGCLIPFPS
jgi:alkylation response protein AidB-like acyl-CoA dehydrogenase